MIISKSRGNIDLLIAGVQDDEAFEVMFKSYKILNFNYNQNFNYHPKLNFNDNQKYQKKLVANDNYKNIFILSLIKNA